MKGKWQVTEKPLGADAAAVDTAEPVASEAASHAARAVALLRDIVAQWEGAEWCDDAARFLRATSTDLSVTSTRNIAPIVSGPENDAMIALWCAIAHISGLPVSTVVQETREQVYALIAIAKAEGRS